MRILFLSLLLTACVSAPPPISLEYHLDKDTFVVTKIMGEPIVCANAQRFECGMAMWNCVDGARYECVLDVMVVDLRTLEKKSREAELKEIQ